MGTYRGVSRSREQVLDELEAEDHQRDSLKVCNATFQSFDGQIWTCPRKPSHRGPHCGDVDGLTCWFDGDGQLIAKGGR